MITIVFYLRKRCRPLSSTPFSRPLQPSTGPRAFLLFMTIFLSHMLFAQSLPIQVTADPSRHIVTVTAGGAPFTSFLYPDTLEKPVLYPIYAPDGQLITRGFPLAPRSGEPVDHPHHIGLWFDYENVNGLDFWNNSYAIPAAKKQQYGWIHTNKIVKTVSGI